jgi:hypothetical protein
MTSLDTCRSSTAETISAIKRAREAGDLAEVDRLKAASEWLLANEKAKILGGGLGVSPVG